MNTKIDEAVNLVSTAQNPIILIGEWSAGKSTFIKHLAASEDVVKLLNNRVGADVSTPHNTEVFITDHEDIPKDMLIIKAKFNYIENIREESEKIFFALIYGILFGQFQGDHSDLDTKELFHTARCTLDNIEGLYDVISNRDLFYMLENYVDSDAPFSKVFENLPDNIIEKLRTSILGAGNEYLKNTEDIPDIQKFLDPQNESYDEALANIEKQFIKAVDDAVDKIYNELFEQIKSHTASNTIDSSFTLYLRKQDEIFTKLLMDSSTFPYVYCLKDMQLIFRGHPELFKDIKSFFYEIKDSNDKSINCIKLVDTKGLNFRDITPAKNTFIENIKALGSYHSTNVIFIHEWEKYIFVNKATKEAFKETLEEVCRWSSEEINLYPVITYLDISIYTNPEMPVDAHLKIAKEQTNAILNVMSLPSNNLIIHEPYSIASLEDSTRSRNEFLLKLCMENKLTYKDVAKDILTDIANQSISSNNLKLANEKTSFF